MTHRREEAVHMKSQEQRIEDAARELERMFPSVGSAVAAAKKVLEAADREPKPWPTDESCSAVLEALRKEGYSNYQGSGSREVARAALLADPIFQAAIAVVALWRDQHHDSERWGYDEPKALYDAVNEAGL